MVPLETTLSVLTPVAPHRADFLQEAAASVEAVRTTLREAGWTVEWVVVIDGPVFEDAPPDAASLVLRLQGQRGVSAAWNTALAACSGSWVTPLDAGDELLSNGLHDVLTSLDPGDGWVATNRVTSDGRRTPHWNDLPRHWQRGELAEAWSAPFPFHPNSLVVRTSVARRAGGWPAVPANEDLGFALAISEIAPGRTIPATTLRYRIWPGQEVAGESYLADKGTSFGVIAEFLNEQRAHRPTAIFVRWVASLRSGPASWYIRD